MNVLGIETSCDETAAAVVADGRHVLSSVVSSQIAAHAGYGGVVPELAAREHLRNLGPVVAAALRESRLGACDMDAVAVTCRPGLIPALLVGVAYAKGIAAAGSLPLVGIDHFLGHLYSCFLAEPQLLDDSAWYPLVAAVVSGGHTALLTVQADGTTRIVGQTLDDAAGEAFDKGARILNLGYPGGPLIERLARQGDPAGHRFPRALTGCGGKPVRGEDRFNFSFSGLKTALLYAVGTTPPSGQPLHDLAAAYQAAIIDVLVRKTFDAAAHVSARAVLVCGGVACNAALRTAMNERAGEAKVRLVIAPAKYCTDNAVMIAGAGYHYVRTGRCDGMETRVSARLDPAFGVLPFAAGAWVQASGEDSAADAN
ncbi:MAG: tRNA N6-adenosine threonylcarbamoyltransferase [Lentisphaerae bacterium ADurb.BinA184]|nr:MAG: tRNA N6-adenosine threonylcarbamoyltransferase [Lentisphaerae bacterium ADurb.BinA184]